MPDFIYGDQRSPFDGAAWEYGALTYPEGAIPSLGDLTGIIAPNQVITFTTENLDPITSVTLGGELLVLDSQVANLVTCTIPDKIAIAWNTTGLTLRASDGTLNGSISGLTLLPRTGWNNVIFDGIVPDPATTEGYHELAVNDLGYTAGIGDELRYSLSTGLTVDTSWVPTVDPAANISGSYEILNVTSSVVSVTRPYFIQQPTSTPDPYTFRTFYSRTLPTVGAPRLVLSDIVTITGNNTPSPISITTGGVVAEYSINGGGWTSSAGTIAENDTLQLRMTATASTHVVTVDIGGEVEDWDFLYTTSFSNAFTFTDAPDSPINSVVVSDSVVIDGYDSVISPATISIVGGEYSLNGGTYTSTEQVLPSAPVGVTVRGLSSESYSTSTAITLGVGYSPTTGMGDSLTSDVFDITTEAEDTTPDAFNFTDQTGVTLNTLVESDTITVSGINAPTPTALLNLNGGMGEYRINGGSWITTGDSVVNGDTVQLRVTSSTLYETTYNTQLDINGVSDIWAVTTQLSPDSIPDPFSFTPVTDADISTLYVSDAAVITGITLPSAYTVVGGEISINGGAFTSVAGDIVNNDSVRLRGVSSGNNGELTSVLLTIGGVAGSFEITTTTVDPIPDPFSFEEVRQADLSTLYTSEVVVITGITESTVTVVDGEISVDGGTFTTAPTAILNNQTVEVRRVSSSVQETEVSATVDIGGVTADFIITTSCDCNVPDRIEFTPITGAEPDTIYESEIEVITGITQPVTVTIDNGEYSINGGDYTAEDGTAVANDTIQLRVTTGTEVLSETIATVIIGGEYSVFSVTVKGVDADYFYNLLGLTPADIPADVIEGFISAWTAVYPNNGCQVLYNTVISIYNWLIAKANAAAVGGTRREKRGRREIELTDFTKAPAYKEALNQFTKAPWHLLPQCRADLGATAGSKIIIGGTRSSEVNRVRSNCNSYSQYSERSPYSPNIWGYYKY